LRPEHVGKTSRAEAAVSQLKELNSNVKVNVKPTLEIADLVNYNVVCYTENLKGIKHIVEANEICHEKRIGFILSETLGLLGYTFTDFGEKHPVNDADGEQTKSFMVVNVSNDEQAQIMVHEDKRHSYQEGDHVKFVEIEGMPELNNRQPVEITKVDGPFAFRINLDTRQFPKYERQGLVEDVKVTKYKNFHSLAKSYLRP